MLCSEKSKIIDQRTGKKGRTGLPGGKWVQINLSRKGPSMAPRVRLEEKPRSASGVTKATGSQPNQAFEGWGGTAKGSIATFPKEHTWTAVGISRKRKVKGKTPALVAYDWGQNKS